MFGFVFVTLNQPEEKKIHLSILLVLQEIVPNGISR